MITWSGAFRRLAERLRGREVRGDIYVFGGAAMILAYGVDRATRDVDAVFVPHGVALEEGRIVAAELGLPPWWLPTRRRPTDHRRGRGAAPVFDHPHLRVQAASARHLVAMKSLAGRQQDLEDLGTLVAQLDLKSADEVLEIISEVFPSEELSDRRRLRIEDMFSEQGRAAPPDRRVGRAQIPA